MTRPMPARFPSCAAATARMSPAADLVIWGVPFDLAVSNRPGTRFGPQALRRVSAIFDGDAQYPSRIDPFEHLSDGRLWRLPAAAQRSAGLRESHRARGCGDHRHRAPTWSRSAATISSPCRYCAPMSPATASWPLIQFDAHQDTWDDGVGAHLAMAPSCSRRCARG